MSLKTAASLQLPLQQEMTRTGLATSGTRSCNAEVCWCSKRAHQAVSGDAEGSMGKLAIALGPQRWAGKASVLGALTCGTLAQPRTYRP